MRSTSYRHEHLRCGYRRDIRKSKFRSTVHSRFGSRPTLLIIDELSMVEGENLRGAVIMSLARRSGSRPHDMTDVPSQAYGLGSVRK